MHSSFNIICILQLILVSTIIIVSADFKHPSIKLYQVDERNRIVKTLGDVSDSEVIVENVERIRLDCEASFPIQWIYTGSGVPVLLSNIRKESDDKYTASAFINSLKEHHTGKYECSSTQYPHKLTSYFYVYVPGPQLFSASTSNNENVVYIPKNDSHILIPCSVSNPSTAVSLEKSTHEVLVPLEVDNLRIIYDPKKGFKLDIIKLDDPEGIYLCTASYNGIHRHLKYKVTYPQKSASIEYTTPSSSEVHHCETHTDCPPNFSCYTDRTCKDPCLNSIRCGPGTVCKYNDRRPYCECLPDFVGDPMKECFNTLQGSDTGVHIPSYSTTKRPYYSTSKPDGGCVSNYDCEQHEKCLKRQCTDPCKTRLCGRNAYCATVNHVTSCNCNPGYFGDANGVLGCGPLKLQGRPDPLTSGKESADTTSVECQTNKDCPADQICRTHVGSHRVCVEVCGSKICGVHSHCTAGNTTFDSPNCLCQDKFTGNPYVGCDEISASRDCVIDNDCQSEERCETGSRYRKCVHLCAKKSCPFNLECEALDHEVRCICPAGFTGSSQFGCVRDFIFGSSGLSDPIASALATAGRRPAEAAETESEFENLVCSSLICGPFSECRIENGQPKCYCQSGYTGTPPKCRQECQTTADCPANKTCVQKRCRNVCRNKCAPYAQCHVNNTGADRIPICKCIEGYTGNAEVKCNRIEV